MTMVDAISLSVHLCGFFAWIQSLEFISLRRTYSPSGVWRWATLEEEFMSQHFLLRKAFRLFLASTPFMILNLARGLVGFILIFHVSFVGCLLLLIFHFLTLIRWRGTFNGGSDYMNLIVLGACTLSLAFPQNFYVVMGAISYVSFQLALSYVKAGYLKIKNPLWRRGLALRSFLSNPSYEQNRISLFVSQSRVLVLIFTWAVLSFELLFPLGLLSPELTVGLLAFAGFFHLGNVYFFGLNRFFFSWLSAYPCFYFSSLYLNSL